MKSTAHSIKSSLSKIVLLIFGISCLIIAILCTSSATSSIIAGKNANYEAAAAIQAQQMEEWFSVQTGMLDELALSVHSLGYDTDKFGDSVPYLADMTAMDSNIYAIYMGREDKSCVFSDGWDAAAENYDPTTRDWYTDAVGSDKTVISAPYVDAESGKMVITVSEAIRDGGKTTAVIAADIFVTSVIEIAESSIDSESYPILIDSQNNIIVHNNPEFIPSVDAQGNESVTSADSILEKGTIPDSTLFTADAYNGVKTVFARTPVGDTGWQYLLAADSSVYYKEVNTMTVFFIVIFVIFLISDTLVLAGAVSRRLRPLGELNAAAEAMNAGDLGYVSKYRKDDEIGSACVAIEEANRKIHGYITDIGDNLSSMASGRFDRRIDMEYIGDFAQLRTSLIGIQNSLRATLQRINSVSQQVSQGSEQAANNAQELSRGAISQTEAVDRLTHTADSFGERLKGTFESTSTADRIANGMNIKVDECSSSMKRLGEAMNNINSTTEQIRIITKTVEDIAFQTNILALNAAVEAARAGSAGKGFAVVADEVRNLASKSAEAAGTTTQLIEKSCIAVENGVKLTQETKSKLEDIVTDTKKMQEHIRSISANAANEKQELDTITEEITNISLVVQSNTAAAEESAASSEELSGQATELNGMLREFSL